MLAELVNKLVDLGRRTDQVIFHQNETLHDTVFVQHGESLQQFPIPPSLRCASLSTLGDLIEACKDPEIAPSPEVYVGEHFITVFLERGDRNEQMACRLDHSDRWKTVKALEGGRSFSPRDAVRFLRFDLYGSNVEGVVQAVSRVDFTRKSDGTSAVAHGRESLGKAVEASVQQADQIPEEFTITVPVFSTPGCKESVNIKCGVYLDMVNEKIHFRVMPDECSSAENAALALIAETLRGALGTTPVFLGRP